VNLFGKIYRILLRNDIFAYKYEDAIIVSELLYA